MDFPMVSMDSASQDIPSKTKNNSWNNLCLTFTSKLMLHGYFLLVFLYADSCKINTTFYVAYYTILQFIHHCSSRFYKYPDSKVYGAHIGPIWGRQDPGGPHVGPMKLAIWVDSGRPSTLTSQRVTGIFVINDMCPWDICVQILCFR